MKVIEGNLSAKGLKFGIIVGRFNEFISSKLLGGAMDALKRSGADENNIEMAWSPGSFEIPLIAKKIAMVVLTRVEPNCIIPIAANFMCRCNKA